MPNIVSPTLCFNLLQCMYFLRASPRNCLPYCHCEKGPSRPFNEGALQLKPNAHVACLCGIKTLLIDKMLYI